ncbi:MULTISPECIES: hypothetical protein [Gordonia]|uniref:hypothetical protein n=1 Tax=Gordonia TaxID=2053 RepID=UPI00257BC4A5|nr:MULTISPECIES: hypothetical protein [Gordonia]
MLIVLRLFGREVLAVEVDGFEEDVDLSDYELSSDTERADYGAWRDEHDEDAEPRPRIIAAGAHRARRRRAPVVAIGTKHRNGPVDVNSKTKGTNGFGFGSSI